jgi:hypothetical protein
LLHVLLSGVLNRITPWTWIAIVILVAEVMILIAFRGRCPLAILAERLGAESGRVTNILLPGWVADRILWIYGSTFVLGCVLVALRTLQQQFGD